jgi:hypothetical protein
MAAYPILTFVFTGNYRVMLLYCDWKRWQIVLYKIIRLYSSIFFLSYGAYMTIEQNVARPQEFLLYIFTTLAFYAEMYFSVNRIDESDNLVPSYTF